MNRAIGPLEMHWKTGDGHPYAHSRVRERHSARAIDGWHRQGEGAGRKIRAQASVGAVKVEQIIELGAPATVPIIMEETGSARRVCIGHLRPFARH